VDNRHFTRRLGASLLIVALAAWSAGCRAASPWTFDAIFGPAAPPTETDTFVLRPEGLTQERPALASSEDATNILAAAREMFRRGEYAQAERYFGRIADNERNGPPAVQESLFYRGECLRLTGYLPKASEYYSALLTKFPQTTYREQANQRMFDIANFWLDDTRAAMREEQERKEGKRWMVMPRFFNWDQKKPMLDEEGRAIELLEKVRLHDIHGPLADRSLFMCGMVKMYHEDYREAEHYFSQIHLTHPESPLAPKSIENAILCKQMSTGGADYDGRKTAEARRLIKAAMHSYPELANDPKKREMLEQQKIYIDLQQAEKEFNTAEFYRRTGHPASAYFLYKMLIRRYPNTKYATLAEERWRELRGKLENENNAPPSTSMLPPWIAPVPPAMIQAPTQAVPQR
jgi:outer membrane protein assembly factor BamD (BamD/ComL family)